MPARWLSTIASAFSATDAADAAIDARLLQAVRKSIPLIWLTTSMTESEKLSNIDGSGGIHR